MDRTEPIGHEALEAIRWRDELLQVLYWMHGEGFGTEVAAAELVSFLQQEEPVIAGWLRQLAAEGYTERWVDGEGRERFRLTPLGLEEGRRRFEDEFADLLHRGGHGECSRPDCVCHQATDPNQTCWSEGGTSHP